MLRTPSILSRVSAMLACRSARTWGRRMTLTTFPEKLARRLLATTRMVTVVRKFVNLLDREVVRPVRGQGSVRSNNKQLTMVTYSYLDNREHRQVSRDSRNKYFSSRLFGAAASEFTMSKTIDVSMVIKSIAIHNTTETQSYPHYDCFSV
ncbi:hypothetical protein EDB92DRAFT_790814 [Lactarius akahatsu]|uniref:Uncharacterized protein n=1 Tax=Lactarius akahatsu TaxID=416441 RepID=A0AAD4LG26_9AGAM|nr:hypothetical protein EDB92DRAFT_790814 [Lactarius akahatsu]